MPLPHAKDRPKCDLGPKLKKNITSAKQFAPFRMTRFKGIGMKKIPLSIIDNANVYEGRTHADALQETLSAAKLADELGYHRYWMAEHHGLMSTASTASGIVVARIASETSRIRVGYGGALMQNHSPLAFAEQCGTLNSYFPGRIDIGLGRTSGADRETSRYLRRGAPPTVDEFPDNVGDLMSLMSPSGATAGIRAYPDQAADVQIFILGSGHYGAAFAAKNGFPYVFAGHFAPGHMVEAVQFYKENFEASERLDEPYAIAALNVIVADNEAEAQRLATTQELYYSRMAVGRVALLPPPSSEPVTMTSQGKSALEARLVGTPASVAEGIQSFAKAVGADELMLNTMIHDPRARLRSIELAIAGYTGT